LTVYELDVALGSMASHTLHVDLPEVQYARSGDVSIAYHTYGDGPIDLVFVTGFVSNIQYGLENPLVRKLYERISKFARLIRLDRRGTGLSDRPREVPTLETRMDDVRAVMNDAGSERAVLLGTAEAAPLTLLFAATYPDRVGALVMHNGYAKAVWSADYPWAKTIEEWRRDLAEVERGWGTEEYFDKVLRRSYPSVADDEEFRRWFVNIMRYGASPAAALTVHRMAMDVDVRDVLPAVRVPTLVLHQRATREHARYLEERIPNARGVELPGEDQTTWTAETLPDEIERFVREVWDEPEPETVLSTVLFTDIVESTRRAAEVGNRAWTQLVSRHHAVVRGQLVRFRGRELDTAGDGFFATFDGPVRAIKCACCITRSVRELGLDVRAGVHTGECEVVEDKVAGLAVVIGSRVAAKAGPGEVLVSSTVKDLVAGSGIDFHDRGIASLKGVPGEWRLFAVDPSLAP
jgi:class 3 adenylate cyclase